MNTNSRANTDLSFISLILEDTSISSEDRLTIIALRSEHWLESLETIGLKNRFVQNSARALDRAYDRWNRRYDDMLSQRAREELDVKA